MLCFSECVDECVFCLLRLVGELLGDASTPEGFVINCFSLSRLFTVDGESPDLNTGLVFGVECTCPGSNGIMSADRSTWHCASLISVLISSRLEFVELDSLSMLLFWRSNFELLPLK